MDGASLVTFSLHGTALAAHRLVMRVIRDQHAASGSLAGLCGRAVGLIEAQADAVCRDLHRDRMISC